MMTIMMMMMMMIKINFLSGTMAIKNGRPRRQKLKKGFCVLLGIHQGGGIGACQKMKKGIQKHCGHKYGLFLYLVTGYKHFLTQKELKKMSLSVQRSVVESFKFNDKHVRFVYVKDVGQCLVSMDVYKVIGYGKEDGVKAIQRLVPEKNKIRFGDAQVDWWTELSTLNQTQHY